MKKINVLFATACLLVAGCSSPKGGTADEQNSSTGGGSSRTMNQDTSPSPNTGIGTNSYPTENTRP
jgi:hypothetical protein